MIEEALPGEAADVIGERLSKVQLLLDLGKRSLEGDIEFIRDTEDLLLDLDETSKCG